MWALQCTKQENMQSLYFYSFFSIHAKVTPLGYFIILFTIDLKMINTW